VSTATADSSVRSRGPRRPALVILLVASVALNLCFMAGAAWIKLHPPAPFPSIEERYRQMAGELDLDTKQRAAFDAYVAAMRARMARMQQQVAPPMNAAWDEIAKPQADSAQVMRLFDEATEKRREFQREATGQTLEFLATLSPAQRSKFVALERERRSRWLRTQPNQR